MIAIVCRVCGRQAKDTVRSIRSFEFRGYWRCANRTACAKRATKA